MSITWNSIRDTLDIGCVLDELGIRVKEIKRGWIIASCPLPSHPGIDSNPSFAIHIEGFSYNCFVCGSGSLPSLVSEIQGIDYDESLRWLARFSDFEYGSEYDSSEFVDKVKKIMESRSRPVSYDRNSVLPIFSPSVLDRWESCPIGLLEKWNIYKESTVDNFKIRFDPSHQRHKYVGPAIIIPHFWKDDLVGYQERWIDDSRPKDVPKYSNTNNFPKRNTIFNYESGVRAAQNREMCLIVESAMTSVRLYDIGIAAVATFGVSLGHDQIKHLQALRGANLVISFDNDVPGQRAAKRLQEKLECDVCVDILSIPDGHKTDLADLSDETVRGLLSVY